MSKKEACKIVLELFIFIFAALTILFATSCYRNAEPVSLSERDKGVRKELLVACPCDIVEFKNCSIGRFGVVRRVPVSQTENVSAPITMHLVFPGTFGGIGMKVAASEVLRVYHRPEINGREITSGQRTALRRWSYAAEQYALQVVW